MKEFFALILYAFLLTQASAQEKIFLAAEDDWYPYSARIGNQAQGRTVDIVRAAYDSVGATLSLEVVPFNRGMIRAKDGHYAGVFNAGLNDDVRRDYLIPRNHVAISEQVVIARIGEPFQGTQSFNGKRLSLTLGYTYPIEITSDPRNKVSRAVGDINGLRMVAARRADFTVIDRLVALSILIREPPLKQQLAIVGTLDSEPIYVVFAKTDAGEKARAAFDQGMDKINRNGALKQIHEDWETKLR